MPLGIPKSMKLEHEEIHRELRRAIKIPGPVGKAAKHVAEVLHPHFERENEIALPVVGVARELAEGKDSPDFPKALELAVRFKDDYERMLQEHIEIVKALDELERVSKRTKKKNVVEFTERLKLHAQTEEAVTYPAVLMAAKLLQMKQQAAQP